jgi:hypothetical protein
VSPTPGATQGGYSFGRLAPHTTRCGLPAPDSTAQPSAITATIPKDHTVAANSTAIKEPFVR